MYKRQGVEGTTFSGYINSGLEKVYAKTQKQKDAEKKKSQAEQDLKDKKNEINGLKDQQQTTADDIKNKSAKLDEILAAQKKLQKDITSKQAEIEQNQKDLAAAQEKQQEQYDACLLYTSPSPRDRQKSRMPSSA